MAEVKYKPRLVESKSLKVRRKSVTALKELYKELKKWLEDHGYDDFREIEYAERNQVGGTKNLEIHWQAFKVINDYVKFRFSVSFLALEMKTVELQRGDQKLKLDKGDFEIRLYTHIMLDPDGKYEKNALTRMFKKFYEEVVIRARIENYKNDMEVELEEIGDHIKKYFEIFTF